MASFPDSVKSFTTKLDGSGNNINAAHVNDLQDEVAAIEGGYLNGTARLNSSNSTFANLSVTGGSTFGAVNAAGCTMTSLDVNGASTFSTRPVAPPPHAAVVFRESTYAAGSSGTSTIAWNAQAVLLNSSMHSTTTNPERLTPQSTGLYQVSAQVFASAGGVAVLRAVEINDSSQTVIAKIQLTANTPLAVMNITGYKRFDVLGGYAICRFLTDAASTQSLSSGVGETWFAMTKL